MQNSIPLCLGHVFKQEAITPCDILAPTLQPFSRTQLERLGPVSVEVWYELRRECRVQERIRLAPRVRRRTACAPAGSMHCGTDGARSPGCLRFRPLLISVWPHEKPVQARLPAN